MRKKLFIAALILGALFMVQGMVVVSFFAFADKQPQTAQSIGHTTPETSLSPREQTGRKQEFLDRFTEARAQLVAAGDPFLEINFSKNKVLKYKKGKVEQEAPILAQGDPQGWGGTPAGLYEVLATNKNAFSGISQVYMPSAIHFYGKYLLHGEPYYPWGEKLASSVSGGCIRLQDSAASKVYDSAALHEPVLVVDKENDGYVYSAVLRSDPPIVSAPSYLVADLDSGFVLAEKNSQDMRPIASLTKLMTALVVAENIDLRKSIEVTEPMLEAYGDIDGLEVGERYRVVELFYPLLTTSSNDAAEAVAGFLGRRRTIEEMNRKSAAIFMRNTIFTDPSGFDQGNQSTAQDLFYLIRYIRNNRPPLLEITKSKAVRNYGEIQFVRQELLNKNLFVNDTSFEGGKTGYTEVSRHTGIFLFRFQTPENDVRTIAFVVLGSANGKLDVQRLYAWLQHGYGLTPDYEIVPSSTTQL